MNAASKDVKLYTLINDNQYVVLNCSYAMKYNESKLPYGGTIVVGELQDVRPRN
jgi:hypothetical protein